MRVARRRLRTAMRLFEEVLPTRAGKLRDELRWIARTLGEVRDLDVQLKRLEGWISKVAPEDREPRGARAVLEQRAKARKRMLRALNSRRYTRFVEAFIAFLERGPSRRSKAARRPIWMSPRTRSGTVTAESERSATA
jgi:triphosphatase